MATVTPGAANKINRMVGVSKVVFVTAAELEGELKDRIFEKGVLLVDEAGKTYRTDGVKKLSELVPVIDQVLVKAEKDALSAALGTGTYAIAANGVVLHGADSKIDDASLKVVTDGKITDSYLAHFFDGSKVLLSALPDSVRAGISYVATFDDLATATDKMKRGLVFVIDASADPDTTSGSAMYAWDVANSKWIMIAEQESLNIDVDSLRPTYANVQASGAVMYDHPLMMDAPTLTQLAGLLDA